MTRLFRLGFEFLRVVLAAVPDTVVVQRLDVGRRFQLCDDNESRLNLSFAMRETILVSSGTEVRQRELVRTCVPGPRLWVAWLT